MVEKLGLRDRKKAQTRDRIADVAAVLFARDGYEAVSVRDVADAAEVSDQTVYNYFPAKQDLVLDRVDEFLVLYRTAILDASDGVSPAAAVHPLVLKDIDRYRGADPVTARGEFPAQCVESPVLRRFSLEFREKQVRTVAAAIVGKNPTLEPIVATAHAAALVSVSQSVTDSIGTSILDGGPDEEFADELARIAAVAFDDLDRFFRHTTISRERRNT